MIKISLESMRRREVKISLESMRLRQVAITQEIDRYVSENPIVRTTLAPDAPRETEEYELAREMAVNGIF